MKNLFWLWQTLRPFLLGSLIIAALCWLSGCASLSVNPQTGEVIYRRFGDQHIKGMEVKKDGDKIIVRMDSQDSEATALTNAITVLGGLAGAAK